MAVNFIYMKYLEKFFEYLGTRSFLSTKRSRQYWKMRRFIITHEAQESYETIQEKLLAAGYLGKDVRKHIQQREDETADIFRDLRNPYNWLLIASGMTIVVLVGFMQNTMYFPWYINNLVYLTLLVLFVLIVKKLKKGKGVKLRVLLSFSFLALGIIGLGIIIGAGLIFLLKH